MHAVIITARTIEKTALGADDGGPVGQGRLDGLHGFGVREGGRLRRWVM